MFISISTFSYHDINKTPLFEHRKHLAETQLDFPVTAFAEKALQQSYKQQTFMIWKEKILLPSSMIKLTKIEGLNYHCFKLNHKIKNCYTPLQNTMDNHTSLIAIEDIPLNLNITGWTVDSLQKNRAYGVILVLGKGNKNVYLEKDPNVVKLLNEPEYLYSSLSVNIDLPPLKAGQYTLEIRTVNTQATGYYTSANITLNPSLPSFFKQALPKVLLAI